MTESRTPILSPDAETIAAAAETLRAGGLVAFPTETVYGLGADATNETAVAAVIAAKGRPAINPLIVHLADADAARHEAHFDDRAERLAACFWPGPLPLVRRRRADSALAAAISAGLETVALRVPSHATALELLRAVGRPIAAPSANRSGRISPTTAAHVSHELGDAAAMILDGGPCAIGLESTVVGFHRGRPVLLRPGGIAWEQLAAVVGDWAVAGETPSPSSPGQLASHYAPDKTLRLNALETGQGEIFLGFGPCGPGGTGGHNLSPDGDLIEAAANLFAMLRRLDAAPGQAIAVAPIPEDGLGRAINDRLRRAAARP